MGQQWKRQLLSTLIVLGNICQIITQNYNDETANFEGFQFPDTDAYPNDIDKRLSKFVRIGRGLSSFIRIGRQSPYGELDFIQSANFPNAIDDDTGDSRNSAFFELDPDNFDKPEKRMSSFVRIGKSYNARDELDEHNTVKRGGAFIRMGKFPSSAYLRNRLGRVNGLAPQPYYRRTGRIGHSSFIRIGKRDTSDAVRRMLEHKAKYGTNQPDFNTPDDNANTSKDEDTENRRYLKIGRDTEIEEDERQKEFVKDTQDQETQYHSEEGQHMPEEVTQETLGKRLSHFVRIGRGDTGYSYKANDKSEFSTIPQQKRLSTFVRIGKSGNSLDKRMSSFVRIGKRRNQQNEIAKRRTSSFVRIGKSSIPIDQNTEGKMDSLVTNDEITEPLEGNSDKRISSFVRIGKSPENLDDNNNKRVSSFVRIGKTSKEMGNDLVKRISSFVRIGRNYPHPEYKFNKRLSSFIRVGKKYPGMENEYNKRFSSFVRIGKADKPDKRMSSFVRIGKNNGDLNSGYNKRLSSFIRVGKDNYDVSKDFENGASDTSNAYYRDGLDKRVLSTFVRIGRNVGSYENSDLQANRGLAESSNDI